MLFLSPDTDIRRRSLDALSKIIAEEGQTMLGIREVPVFLDCIGKSARAARPHICQVIIGRNPQISELADFERKLYIIGKRAEREIRYSDTPADSYFYFSSLSARTLVYKGMLTPEQVCEFYLLPHESLRCALDSLRGACHLCGLRCGGKTLPGAQRC